MQTLINIRNNTTITRTTILQTPCTLHGPCPPQTHTPTQTAHQAPQGHSKSFSPGQRTPYTLLASTHSSSHRPSELQNTSVSTTLTHSNSHTPCPTSTFPQPINTYLISNAPPHPASTQTLNNTTQTTISYGFLAVFVQLNPSSHLALMIRNSWPSFSMPFRVKPSLEPLCSGLAFSYAIAMSRSLSALQAWMMAPTSKVMVGRMERKRSREWMR